MTFENKYRFKHLKKGERHFVEGSDSHLVHNALNLFRKRNPDLRHCRFRTRTVFNGCFVERVE